MPKSPAINKCIFVFISELPSKQTKNGTETTVGTIFQLNGKRVADLAAKMKSGACPYASKVLRCGSVQANGLWHEMTNVTTEAECMFILSSLEMGS